MMIMSLLRSIVTRSLAILLNNKKCAFLARCTRIRTLNYIYIYSNVSYLSSRTSTDGTSSVEPCIYGNMYNLRIGRGIKSTNSSNCSLAQIQGGYYNHNSSEYKLVVESGIYHTIQLYRAGGGTGA